MSQWAVTEFVTRVAERMNTAKQDLAAQFPGHHDFVFDGDTTRLHTLFPMVEPSPQFIMSLRRQLLEAPILIPTDAALQASSASRRVLYGVAAVGSLASAAAVVAVILYRSRPSAQRSAA